MTILGVLSKECYTSKACMASHLAPVSRWFQTDSVACVVETLCIPLNCRAWTSRESSSYDFSWHHLSRRWYMEMLMASSQGLSVREPLPLKMQQISDAKGHWCGSISELWRSMVCILHVQTNLCFQA